MTRASDGATRRPAARGHDELARLRGMLETLLAPRGTRGQPQPTSLARRADIIAAAIHIIARDGIRACTITALERATGFARGHFTYHFDSKEQIIGLAFAAVGSDFAMSQAEATFGGSAAERLEHRVRAAVAWAQCRPTYFQCLMNFRVEMMRNADAFRPAARIRSQMWEVAAQMIRDGVAEGSFHVRTDPLTEARVIFAAVDGMMMHAAMDAGFGSPDALADLAWRVVADRLSVPR